MTDHVTVAVRLRPWISSDTGTRRQTVHVQDGTTAELLDPATGHQRALFSFDCCFDSATATDAQADQAAIFDRLAPPLLSSCVEGYNITMFAYGQTGSGKSHTMVGSREAPGFTPRFISALFSECDMVRRADPGVEIAVEASYLEIYMETVRDLLNPTVRPATRRKSNDASSSTLAAASGGLRVREHPRTGPYVEDLSKVACGTAVQVATLLEHGNSVRAVRATNMNAASSRSHAIFTLKVTQRCALEDSTRTSAVEIGRASCRERV